MASGDAVQQIKDRLNILDVVGQYVELHQAGRQFKGRCPFHSEKTPSFHVSPDRGTYHCFGCGVGGDIFSFIEAIEGVEFRDALKQLAEKAGVELVPENREKRGERDTLYAALLDTTAFYEAELLKNSEALGYLEKRGVTKETIKKWRIGYAPGPPTGGWRDTKTFLNAAGYSDSVLLKAGIIKNADQGKEPFDVFRDRIMFPLRDAAGRVVAFSGRILHPDDKSPKYVNSPETELFKKSDVLYGYDFAKHHIRQLPFWLLVEGQFDVVMSHQCGYATAVAVSGTAFTTNHAQLLERLSKNVVLGLDTDKAGVAAMKKSADLLLRRGLDVKVARFKDGTDPADMVRDDVGEFKKAIKDSVHVIEFLLAQLRGEIPDDRTYKLRVRTEVVPFVSIIPNRIDQDHFEGVIATALGTSKEAIHYEVLRLETTHKVEEQKAPEKTASQPTEDVATTAHKLLVYLLAARRVIPVADNLVITQFLETISGAPLDELENMVEEGQIRAATFQLESQFTTQSDRVRHDELTHRLNLYRQLTAKERLAKARSAVGTVTEPDESTLTELGAAAAVLRLPPLTPTIFKEI